MAIVACLAIVACAAPASAQNNSDMPFIGACVGATQPAECELEALGLEESTNATTGSNGLNSGVAPGALDTTVPGITTAPGGVGVTVPSNPETPSTTSTAPGSGGAVSAGTGITTGSTGVAPGSTGAIGAQGTKQASPVPTSLTPLPMPAPTSSAGQRQSGTTSTGNGLGTFINSGAAGSGGAAPRNQNDPLEDPFE